MRIKAGLRFAEPVRPMPMMRFRLPPLVPDRAARSSAIASTGEGRAPLPRTSDLLSTTIQVPAWESVPAIISGQRPRSPISPPRSCRKCTFMCTSHCGCWIFTQSHLAAAWSHRSGFFGTFDPFIYGRLGGRLSDPLPVFPPHLVPLVGLPFEAVFFRGCSHARIPVSGKRHEVFGGSFYSHLRDQVFYCAVGLRHASLSVYGPGRYARPGLTVARRCLRFRGARPRSRPPPWARPSPVSSPAAAAPATPSAAGSACSC